MKKENHQSLTVAEKIASALLLGFGLATNARALYWIVESDNAINDSPFYQQLNDIMPLWIWGSILFIFGATMCLASFFIPSRFISRKFDLSVLFGCTGAAIFYFFMTIVSMIDALNWLTPLNFLIQTSCLGLCGFIGGISYASKR